MKREKHASDKKVAELQGHIAELRHQLEQVQQRSEDDRQRLQSELTRCMDELNSVLEDRYQLQVSTLTLTSLCACSRDVLAPARKAVQYCMFGAQMQENMRFTFFRLTT